MKRLTMHNGDVTDDDPCSECGEPLGDSYIRAGALAYCSLECYEEASPESVG